MLLVTESPHIAPRDGFNLADGQSICCCNRRKIDSFSKLRVFGIQDFVGVPQNVEECIPHNFDGRTLLQDCYLLEIWSGNWNADLRSTFLNILLFWIAYDCYTVFYLVGLFPGSKLTRAGAWSGPMVDVWASPTVGQRKRRRLGLGRGGRASNGGWKCYGGMETCDFTSFSPLPGVGSFSEDRRLRRSRAAILRNFFWELFWPRKRGTTCFQCGVAV